MKKVKYWENRTPPPEYYAPVDPYREPPAYNLNHAALSRYAKRIGKKIADMSAEEIAPFFNGVPYGEKAADEK